MYAPGPHLTPRLKQVVDLLKQGTSTRDIGGALGISTHTVDTYILIIKEKYGAATERQLMAAIFTIPMVCRDKRIK
jgi:DNA-binding CsgD family transcriptional regulator